MAMQKVYVVRRFYWADRFDESDWSYEVLDSIWSRLEDAKRRIDDLANEYVRRQWYDQDCILEGFECNATWAKNKLSVKMATNPYEEEEYYIEEFCVDPELPDFEGP